MTDDPPGLDLFGTEDPYEFPSDEDIVDLPKEEQITFLYEWFDWNFEDPAEMTPHDSSEGGYIYIWGGPYDAQDELYGRFGEVVDEEIIQASVDKIQSDGLSDWAPASRRIRSEDEVESDEADTGDYDEAIFRERVRQSLNELEKAVDQLKPARSLIGHNNPPELLIDIPYTIDDEEIVRRIIRNVRDQVEAEGEPLVANLDASRQTLTEFKNKIGAWISQKAELSVDEAAKSFGKTIGNLAAVGVVAALALAIYNFWALLQAAAKAIGDWISFTQLP